MIRLEHLSKSYPSSTASGQPMHAVRDVSLHVRAGAVLALVGTSGCGKTTTLKMINRLIEPTSGVVLIGGQDVREVDAVSLRRQIGYVFQMIGLMPHWTVGDNVATVPRLLGWPDAKVRSRTDELLAMVGLDPSVYRDRRPAQLSGGQRQRVGFARALAAGPKVMLLDEPFGAIDPIQRSALQDEFKAIQKTFGLTVVMVTHDVSEALLLADTIAVMDGGQVLRAGSPRELMTDPQHPYVELLINTPRRHAESIERLADLGKPEPAR